MGILDFLKKWTKKPEEEPKTEKIPLSNLKIWTESKIKDFKIKEKEILVSIQEKTEFLANEIQEKINAAKDVDLNSKKEQDKLKAATEEGRKKYIESVEVLTNSLRKMKKEELEKTITDIDKLFSYFNKISKMSYERATILIGKEMVEIKESLESFSKILIEIFEQNKNFIEFYKTISIIQLNLTQVEKIEKEIKQIKNEILLLDNESAKKEKEKRDILIDIEAIRKSPEYLEEQKMQQEINSEIGSLDKVVFNLGQSIDFKALGNFYHIFENKMQIVKAHRDSFQLNFEKDDGKTIINLLETANLKNKDIAEKINSVFQKKEEILQLKNELENKEETKKEIDLDINSKKRIQEIEDLKNKKIKDEKRQEKLKEDKEKFTNELKESLKKIKIELD